jgi:hypothetical protein
MFDIQRELDLSKYRIDAPDHGMAIERLAEEADSARFQSALPDAFLGEGNDHNGRYPIATCDQMILQLYSGHSGHLDIADQA